MLKLSHINNDKVWNNFYGYLVLLVCMTPGKLWWTLLRWQVQVHNPMVLYDKHIDKYLIYTSDTS